MRRVPTGIGVRELGGRDGLLCPVVLHPVPTPFSHTQLCACVNGTERYRPLGTVGTDPSGTGPPTPQLCDCSVTARNANRYEPIPKPAIVPEATAATTELCRNSSLAWGLEMCTSMSGAVRCAAASRMPYE